MMPRFGLGDRVRVGVSVFVSRVSGFSSTGRVVVTSEFTGRSRLVEMDALRAVR